MKDYRKYCRPKTIKFPQTGDIEVLLKDGTTVYVKAKDFLKVSKFFKDYSLYEEGSGSGNGSEHDYSQDYLTFEALEAGTFTFTSALSYSLDGGSTWTALAANTATPSIAVGKEICFKAELIPDSSSGIGTFSATGNFNAKGNPMSLLFGDNFAEQTSLSGKTYVFKQLFYNNTKLISAEYLSLSATTLAGGCYANMFSDCTSLTTAPELPATTLVESCYQGMFRGCTTLITAPELPATTLAESCYSSMFSGCTSLTTAPELPAMTLQRTCYYYMFQNCTSLTTAPELPATTLKRSCYSTMFNGCTNLTTAPELPATTLAEYCYEFMFAGCTSLTTAPELSATTLANYCYKAMFKDCTSLTTAPELPATMLTNSCYYQMFYGCSSLNYIKAAFRTTPSLSYTNSWVNGVAASGIFVKNSEATWTTTGTNGIPTGWTVQTYTP